MVQLDDLIDRFENQSKMIQETREKVKKEANKMYDPEVNGERNSTIGDPKYTKVDEEKLMKTNRIDANYYKDPSDDKYPWSELTENYDYESAVSPLKQKEPLECKVCGNRFTPLKENKYIIKKHNVLTKTVDFYDAFDCPFCGCQVVANIRYLGK